MSSFMALKTISSDKFLRTVVELFATTVCVSIYDGFCEFTHSLFHRCCALFAALCLFIMCAYSCVNASLLLFPHRYVTLKDFVSLSSGQKKTFAQTPCNQFKVY